MKVIRSAVAAISILVLLAGCSTASPVAGSAGPPTSTAEQASSTDAGTADAGTADAGTVDAGTADAGTADAGTVPAAPGTSVVHCTAVTKADAQAFMTDPITKNDAQPFGSNSDGETCTFNTDNGGSVEIDVVPDSDPIGSYATQVKEFAKPVSVPGIGDQAARDGNEESGAMLSIKAGTVCSVTASDENIPGVGALDEAAGATNNIGDANYAIIAAALGTLCNRIFGSGNTTPDLSGLKTIVSGAPSTS